MKDNIFERWDEFLSEGQKRLDPKHYVEEARYMLKILDRVVVEYEGDDELRYFINSLQSLYERYMGSYMTSNNPEAAMADRWWDYEED